LADNQCPPHLQPRHRSQDVAELGARLVRAMEAEMDLGDTFDLTGQVRGGKIRLKIEIVIDNPGWKPR